ncbi:hypothetical protein [Herbaspirillum rubrisubalbicans]|uniref:hypothetical protein n=1 Tax=Herbaspirillum rubrisubalbicans TaxID=80842 RepID=UPI0015C52BF1|nr:hypothetical protein [Herbaspirillum rubrisubalbicans]
MQVKYPQAALRHMKDAAILEERSRPHNAGQLYGIAAECGLKALLVAKGSPTTPTGDLKEREDRKHLPDLKALMSTITVFSDGRQASQYLAMMPDLNNFDDWKIDHRYWIDAQVPVASLGAWKIAANQVAAMVEQANIDGIL